MRRQIEVYQGADKNIYLQLSDDGTNDNLWDLTGYTINIVVVDPDDSTNGIDAFSVVELTTNFIDDDGREYNASSTINTTIDAGTYEMQLNIDTGSSTDVKDYFQLVVNATASIPT